MAHNKGYYEGIDLIPLFIYLVLLFPLFFVALGCARCGAWIDPHKSYSKTKSCCSFTRWAWWFYTLLKRGGEVWLSRILMHEFKKDGEEFVLKGCRIHKWYVFWASIMPVTVGSFVTIVFWEVFLIRASFACSDDVYVDCFRANDSWSAQPLNCSELSGDDNVICYAFVFDFIVGLSAAGGALSIITKAMYASIWVETTIVTHFRGLRRRLIFLFPLLVLPAVGYICLLILAIITVDTKMMIQVAFGLVAVYSTFIFPWSVAKKDPNQIDKEEGDLCPPPCFQCCCRGTTDQEETPEEIQENISLTANGHVNAYT